MNGKQLWEEIETPQGYAFISDDCLEWSDERVKGYCAGALMYARKVVRILERASKADESPDSSAITPTPPRGQRESVSHDRAQRGA